MTRHTESGIDVTETGAIITVFTSRAGGLLDGDHPTGSTQLAVQLGWDFAPTGGTLSLGGTVYAYTSAVVQGEPLPDLPDDPDDEEPPDPDAGWDEQTGEDGDVDEWLVTENDDRPTIIRLAEPLAADATDGDLVALEPESITKTAEVQLADFDEPINARIPHGLMDRIAEGSRGTLDDAETVAVRLDGATWVIDDVMGKPPAIEADALDPDGPPVPGQLIPGEGWEYMGPIAPENILTGTLQAKVQIGEEIWVVQYADPTDPDSLPDPDSGIVSITPADGLRLRIPNQDDPDAEPETLVHLPTTLYDEAGNRVTAVFQGRADFSVATAQQFRATGIAADGDVSTIATAAELQLNNAVADPSSEPNVIFGPRTRSWSNTPADYIENGWGVSGSNVVFAVRNTATNGGLRFRFMDPVNGRLDHDVQCQISPANVAGITVFDGHIYMIFRALGKWSLSRFDMNGNISGNGANITPWVNGPGQVCVGNVNGSLLLAYRDQNSRIRIRQYWPGKEGLLEAPYTWATDYFDSNGRVLSGISAAPGSDNALLFTGSRIVQLDAWTTANEPASFWSGIGSVAGGGLLPDGKVGAFDGQGTCAVYNDDPAVDVDATTSFATTVANTATGRESGISPVATRTWTAKAFATVQADRLVPGTNQVRFYGSTTGETYADMFRLGQSSTAVVIGPLTRIPASGLQPPGMSQFTSSGEIPGRIVSQALIPGTMRRAAFIDAQGNAEFHGLTQPWISRANAAGQAVANGAWVRLTWPTAYETHPDISYSAGVFTVRHSGAYVLTAQATITGFTNNTRFACRVLHNDVSIARTGQHATGSTFCTTGIYGLKLRLLAGDRLHFEVNQNSGTLQTLNADADQNWIQITRPHA